MPTDRPRRQREHTQLNGSQKAEQKVPLERMYADSERREKGCLPDAQSWKDKSSVERTVTSWTTRAHMAQGSG